MTFEGEVPRAGKVAVDREEDIQDRQLHEAGVVKVEQMRGISTTTEKKKGRSDVWTIGTSTTPSTCW